MRSGVEKKRERKAMTGRLKIHAVLFAIFVVVKSPMTIGQESDAQGFTSAHIAAASAEAALECTDYCVVGACSWLVCGLFGCTIETSLKVAHNRPDLIVSTYNQPGDIPYKEAGVVYGHFLNAVGNTAFSSFGGMEGGEYRANANMNQQKKENPALAFKEASIISSLFSGIDVHYMCDSAAGPFQPFYQSELDAIAWRFNTDAFHYKSWLPGVNEVGDWPLYSFGSVYPRTGFIIQNDDVKASEVIAGRSMAVLVDGGMGHVRRPFTNEDAGQKEHEIVDNPTPWQPIYPHAESSCMALGECNDPAWLANHHSDDGRRGWVYWTRYQCCLSNRGIFLSSIEFPQICI